MLTKRLSLLALIGVGTALVACNGVMDESDADAIVAPVSDTDPDAETDLKPPDGPPQCGEDLSYWDYAYQYVGFPHWGELPETATVLAVHDDRLELEFESNSYKTSIDFLWMGPSLVDLFQVGEKVVAHQSESHAGWDYVAGANHTVATLSEGGWVLPKSIQNLPFDGPSVAIGPVQCSDMGTSVHELTAKLDSEHSQIAYGESQSIGPWELTNMVAYQVPMKEYVDAWSHLIITATGPAPSN